METELIRLGLALEPAADVISFMAWFGLAVALGFVAMKRLKAWLHRREVSREL